VYCETGGGPSAASAERPSVSFRAMVRAVTDPTPLSLHSTPRGRTLRPLHPASSTPAIATTVLGPDLVVLRRIGRVGGSGLARGPLGARVEQQSGQQRRRWLAVLLASAPPKCRVRRTDRPQAAGEGNRGVSPVAFRRSNG
jgi:hypothetical protein